MPPEPQPLSATVFPTVLPIEAEQRGEIVVDLMRNSHLPAVMRLFTQCPETAFQDWEDQSLLQRHITQQPTFNWVATRQQDVVGALIGGSVGVRGTISHVAVRHDARKCGIASRMVTRALQAFEQQGIFRVYLFTQVTNAAAVGLWTSLGFHDTAGETTLEVDLPSWSFDASATG